MSFYYEKKCLQQFKQNGETHVTVYPAIKIVFIDNYSDSKFRKAFFCDFNGNILCPSQMNRLFKKRNNIDSVSNFYNNDISLIFFTCDAIKLHNIEENTYFNLSNKCKSCYLKVIYANGNFCLGTVRSIPDQELSECLKLLPNNLAKWNQLVLTDESIKIVK
jgi:hypothetical protein